MSIGISGGLGGGSLRTGSYILVIISGLSWRGHLPKGGIDVGGIVIGGSGTKGNVGAAGLGCSWGIGFNLGLVISLIAPTLSHHFLGRAGWVHL